MPRLNPTFKNMVFFLYGRHPKTGKIRGPLGTGFFVGLEGKGTWYLRHYYAVTCWHVAVKRGASIIRINTKDGKSRQIEFEPHEWQFIPQRDDLCAVDVTDRLILEQDETSSVLPSMIVTKDFVRDESVEIGEDGFMLGLFAELPGEHRNMIAARFGNISLLANDDALIEQPNGQKRPSHIFDMRSRPGFSGSPVFAYRTPSGDLRSATERGRDKAFRRRSRRSFDLIGPGGDFGYQIVDNTFFHDTEDEWETRDNTFLMLLGVHAAQYPEKVEARKIKPVVSEDDDVLRDRDKLYIPSSMAVVIPAWEITHVLNLPIFQAERDKRDERIMEERDKKNIPEPEATDDVSGGDKGTSPSTDANPNHLKDFARLVDIAARKKSKD
jgi:hypothetical protein